MRAAWSRGGEPLNLVAGELRLGVDASYPPLAVAEADGSLRGFEVEVARELASRLEVPLRLDNTDVGGGLDALAANRYDGILAGLSSSRDLEDRAAFSRPYFDDGTLLVGLRQQPRLDAMTGRVAVELGSAAERSVRRRLPGRADVELIRRVDPASAVRALRDGEAELALLDATSARQALAWDPELRLAAEPFESRPLAIALRRPNRGLRFAIDDALATMERDGLLESLARRWLGA